MKKNKGEKSLNIRSMNIRNKKRSTEGGVDREGGQE